MGSRKIKARRDKCLGLAIIVRSGNWAMLDAGSIFGLAMSNNRVMLYAVSFPIAFIYPLFTVHTFHIVPNDF